MNLYFNGASLKGYIPKKFYEVKKSEVEVEVKVKVKDKNEA